MQATFDRCRTFAAAFLFVVAAAPSPVHAAPNVAVYANQQGCFVRRYDREHLSAHPHQTVEAIRLGRRTARDPDSLAARNDAVLDLAFRIKGEVFDGVAYCRKDQCTLEGDGGAFTLRRSEDDLQFSVGAHLSLEGANGFSPDLAHSADDRVFRLRPAPRAACSTGEL